MSSSLLRQVSRHAPPRRYATPSSLTKRAKSSHAPLPPKKMRALVSIYHQSETFITPETLSDAVDTAFRDVGIWNGSFQTREIPVPHLQAELQARKVMPKLTSGDSSADLSFQRARSNELWSATTPEREAQVRAALYGVDPLSSQDAALKPGLEVLEEEQERIRKLLKSEEW